jgi:hypothetical protein
VVCFTVYEKLTTGLECLCYNCVNVCVIVYERHDTELGMIGGAAVCTIVVS